VRTSAGNLNFNYLAVTPKPRAFKLGIRTLNRLVKQRLNDQPLKDSCYECDMSHLSHNRQEVPYAVAFETAHFGGDIGIVSGAKNRPAALKWSVLEWDKQQQYEGHAQLIFRLKDQHDNAVEQFDVRLNSASQNPASPKLERMIEDHHGNKKDKGTITFYLRTQSFDRKRKVWRELLSDVAGVSVEITGYEPDSGDISYVPMNIQLDRAQINALLQSFRTTIIDITLVRLPSDRVFTVEPG
jgi:hypothetical protein